MTGDGVDRENNKIGFNFFSDHPFTEETQVPQQKTLHLNIFDLETFQNTVFNRGEHSVSEKIRSLNRRSGYLRLVFSKIRAANRRRKVKFNIDEIHHAKWFV